MNHNYLKFQFVRYTRLKLKYQRKLNENHTRSSLNKLSSKTVELLTERVLSIDQYLKRIHQTLLRVGAGLGVCAASLLVTPSQAQIFDETEDSTFALTGLDEVYQVKTNFVDMDEDGDLDILLGATHDRPGTEPWYFYGVFMYYENTAEPGKAPVYGTPEVNPWGLDSIQWSLFPTVEDIDQDGDLDILAGDLDKYFLFYENTAGQGNTPSFASAVQNPFGLTDISAGYSFYANPVISDFDNDGDMDVLSGDYYGDFIYFENTAGQGNTPSFAPLTQNPFGLVNTNTTTTPILFDVDEDGDLDLLSHYQNENYDNSIAYFENTADPNQPSQFAAPEFPAFGLPVDISSIILWPAIADIDGDTDPDLVLGHSTKGLRLYTNREVILNLKTKTSPQVGIFPNPVSSGSTIHIEHTESLELAILRNNLGQQITTLRPNGSSIQLPGVQAGSYVLELIDKHGTHTTSLIVK